MECVCNVIVSLNLSPCSKLMFVLRIGSHDGTPSCHVELSDPQRGLDKGVVLQYSPDNGVSWTTINVHDPLDFRKVTTPSPSLIGTDCCVCVCVY